MFFHPQPPTTQPFVGGYVCYMRLLSIANMVMAGLYHAQGLRIGMHVKYDDKGNTVVNLYLLGLTPRDKSANSFGAMALISNLNDGLILAMKKRGEYDTSHPFSFAGESDAESNDMRIAMAVTALAVAHVQDLYASADIAQDPANQGIQAVQPGEFMQRVTSIRAIGHSTNYEATLDDGKMVRFTMPTEEGAKFEPGDWLHHDHRGCIQRVAPMAVN